MLALCEDRLALSKHGKARMEVRLDQIERYLEALLVTSSYRACRHRAKEAGAPLGN